MAFASAGGGLAGPSRVAATETTGEGWLAAALALPLETGIGVSALNA